MERSLAMEQLFSFKAPERELMMLCKREGFQLPVPRLIAETGRQSVAPVFVVGIYSGSDKLGEGQGSSLSEAKFRANSNALKAWYLYEQTDVDLPSVNEDRSELKFRHGHIDSGAVIV